MKDDHGCHRCGRSLSDCRCQQEDAASVSLADVFACPDCSVERGACPAHAAQTGRLPAENREASAGNRGAVQRSEAAQQTTESVQNVLSDVSVEAFVRKWVDNIGPSRLDCTRELVALLANAEKRRVPYDPVARKAAAEQLERDMGLRPAEAQSREHAAEEVVERIRSLIDHDTPLSNKQHFVNGLMEILDSTEIGCIGWRGRNEAQIACGAGNVDGTRCVLAREHDGNHYDGIGYWAMGVRPHPRPLAPEMGNVWRCARHGSPSCAVCALDTVRAAHLAQLEAAIVYQESQGKRRPEARPLQVSAELFAAVVHKAGGAIALSDRDLVDCCGLIISREDDPLHGGVTFTTRQRRERDRSIASGDTRVGGDGLHDAVAARGGNPAERASSVDPAENEKHGSAGAVQPLAGGPHVDRSPAPQAVGLRPERAEPEAECYAGSEVPRCQQRENGLQCLRPFTHVDAIGHVFSHDRPGDAAPDAGLAPNVMDAPGHPRCRCGSLSQIECGLCLSCATRELREDAAIKRAEAAEAEVERLSKQYAELAAEYIGSKREANQ